MLQLAISVEHQLVTDRQTDRQTDDYSIYYASMASNGKAVQYYLHIRVYSRVCLYSILDKKIHGLDKFQDP